MNVLIGRDGRQVIIDTRDQVQRFELTDAEQRAQVYRRVERVCAGAPVEDCEPRTPLAE
jgi:hypothetical protein